MKVEFEDLTEEEISVFEEYRKEKAELEKTDKARYEELQCAVNNIITALSPQEHFIFKEAFKLVDKPSGNEDGEADLRFEVTLQRLHQIEAKALRRLRFLRRASSLKDYLDDTLYVLVEDTVPEEQKAALQNACESFAKRMNLKNANITFLNNPSKLDFSYPDDSGLPKGFFDKNVLLIPIASLAFHGLSVLALYLFARTERWFPAIFRCSQNSYSRTKHTGLQITITRSLPILLSVK